MYREKELRTIHKSQLLLLLLNYDKGTTFAQYIKNNGWIPSYGGAQTSNNKRNAQ